MQTHEIRQRFTDHFVKSGHTEVPSASLILDDPNLLFVNAGMVPFKPYFLGQETPPFGTATSIQKCVRTLDIDEVGITTRHNTFFQMAGNFSFGQYFKEGAIKNAWTLLTNSVDNGGLGLDPDRLWVTVYEDDDEAAQLWHDLVGLPTERIQRLGMEDNYWHMGVPGPCGPCSEIYYDRGPAYGEDGGPAVDDSRFIEIWNLVFMEFERGETKPDGSFDLIGNLPKKNIDTGMGVERLAFLLQGVDNVYETDLLRPVIDTAEKLTGTRYGTQDKDDIRFRVIADHSRTALMLILDGVTPGNEGRGYILRRLIRRIIRSARLLGAQGAVIEQLLATVREAMTPSYPEIEENWERIRSVGVTEEKAFLKTLESGSQLFEQFLTEARNSGTSVVPGEVAFSLHDTHGFPIDLTREMAEEASLTVDEAGFHELMAEQKARAKADNAAKKHVHADLSVYRAFIDSHPTHFTGYENTADEGKVLGLVVDGQLADRASGGQLAQVILDQTPFYAESGGQMADRGSLRGPGGLAKVVDVQKIAKKVWVHQIEVIEGELAIGELLEARVDQKWRHQARQAHSGTHLIHAALREVLGPTAVQAGSMNKPGYLRFDFSYGDQLTEKQLQQIEEIANSAVDTDYQVNTIETSLEEAKAMGAMALFGENYGNQVRVVEIGGPFSMELCGGIHVDHSSQIGPISVLGESSVGSGVRRIEAYTGMDSFRHLAADRSLVANLAANFKATSEEIPERIDTLTAKLKAAEKQVQQLRAQQLAAQVGSTVDSAADVSGVKVLTQNLGEGLGAKDLRSVAQDAIARFNSDAAVVLFTAQDGEKVPFVVAANPQAVERGLKAGDLVKAFGAEVGGRGGGKPALAQGSGSDASGVDAGLAAVQRLVNETLS